jgi:hypothetical protein
MAPVKLLEKDEVNPIAKEVFQKAEDSTGKVISLFKALAHSPKICPDWNRMGVTILMKGELRNGYRFYTTYSSSYTERLKNLTQMLRS